MSNNNATDNLIATLQSELVNAGWTIATLRRELETVTAERDRARAQLAVCSKQIDAMMTVALHAVDTFGEWVTDWANRDPKWAAEQCKRWRRTLRRAYRHLPAYVRPILPMGYDRKWRKQKTND